MKRKSASFLAGVLVASMVATPLSYTNVYAQERDLVEADAVQQEVENESSDVVEESNQENTSTKEEEKVSDDKAPEQDQKENVEEKSDNSGTVEAPAVSEQNETGQKSQENPVVLQEAITPKTVTPTMPTAIITGVKVVKNDGKDFGMFPVTDAEVTSDGENLKISFNTGKKKTYSKIYLGSQTDENKSENLIKTGSLNVDKYYFEITVPLSKKNSWIPIAVGKSDGSWNENYLWMSIPDPDSTTIVSQPQSVEKKEGEQVDLSIKAAGNGLSYQWQFSKDGKNWSDCEGETAKSENYSFQMQKELVGKYRCILKNQTGKTLTSDVIEVKIPLSQPEIIGNQIKVVKEDGTDFKMFTVDEASIKEEGEKLNITISTNNTSYNKIYFGSKDDVDKKIDCEGTEKENGGWTFKFELPVSSKGKVFPITLWKKKDNSWYTNTSLFMYIPEKISEDNTDPDPTPDPNPGVVAPADGIYKVNNVTSSSSMFNVVDCKLTSRNGKMSAVLTLSGTGYDYLYAGTAEEAAKADKSAWSPFKKGSDGKYTYTIPVESLDKGIAVAAFSHKNQIWYDRTLTFHSDSLEKTGDLSAPENGIYSIDVDSSASMFRVVDCKLTSKDGKMSAVLTLSGTGYGYLYMGTKEEAAQADPSSWIPYVVDSNEKYTYTVPVEALDKGISVAAYSTKNKIWYDRILTFKSETLNKIGDIDSGNGGAGGNSGTTGGNTNPSGGTGGSGSILKPNDGKADNESKYEADTTGATGRVNSSTTLADGVYTPDRFTWSGGTGKVKIYCNKITIKNGQAYATLVFDSDHYQYVKANGNTYYTSKGGGTATVTIPVALNQNNKILGMTDKMSVAHEIEYTIFVYLAAAGNGTTLGGANANKKLDEKAPEIMGLQYQSETQLDYAEYFKIYHYDQGITLLEVDMTKGTANDPEKLAAEAINAENTDAETTDISDDAQADQDKQQTTESKDIKSSADEEEASVSAVAEDGEENLNGVSEAELAAELYKGNVVKYLLVPEGVEIPVGLDQDMIVVQLPADKAYTSKDYILEKMDEFGLTDNIVAIGDKKKDCKIDSIAEKMEKKDGEDHAQVVYGGTEEEPDYKTLVKQETNLAILSSDILPKEADITDIQEKQDASEEAEKNTDKKDEKSKKKSDKKDEKTEKDAAKDSANQEELTVEEQTERYQQMTEKFALLGIPVIVDRSEDEQTDLAKYEWIKVYGVLFGCEDQMNDLFDQAVKDAGDDAIAQARVQTEK